MNGLDISQEYRIRRELFFEFNETFNHLLKDILYKPFIGV